MNKKIQKICSFALIFILIVTMASIVFAADPFTPGSIDEGNVNTKASNQIKNVGNSVVGILRTVGIVLSVVVLIVLGIKYMMGSAEEKSEYKKTMIPYLVGAALIFAASAFAEVIFQFFNGISVS